MLNVQPATKPTIYFIGVTTGKSSIMRVFPKWAQALGLDAEIKGIDFKPHSPGESYREAVEFIKRDPLSLGALVTTHKIDLYHACQDLFEYLDPFARKLGEISCISKKDGKLCGHAKDPISSGLALEHFVPENYWKDHDGEVFLMGAGGAALAMSLYFGERKSGDDIPKKIIISNRSLPRLESARRILDGLNPEIQFEYVHTPQPEDNDCSLASLKPYSLVVNATGLEKDAPGSPLTEQCSFPENSLVWEINYRGELIFMDQAKAQAETKKLYIEDGWIYFIHGWTQVVAEVFHIDRMEDKVLMLSEVAKNA